MWREEGTDTTALFGIMDDAKDETLVITEGEFDCAAVYEASKRNVVSVPNGRQDFGWIEANWEVLEKYKKIILCGDNDEAGHEMIEKLIPKLGEYRCSVVQIPETCKDANEVLVKHGKFFLSAIIKEAKEVNLSGILRLAGIVFQFGKILLKQPATMRDGVDMSKFIDNKAWHVKVQA